MEDTVMETKKHKVMEQFLRIMMDVVIVPLLYIPAIIGESAIVHEDSCKMGKCGDNQLKESTAVSCRQTPI